MLSLCSVSFVSRILFNINIIYFAYRVVVVVVGLLPKEGPQALTVNLVVLY